MKFKEYNNLAGIYKWENKINHKCYIGQSVNLGSRLRHHINNLKHRRYDAPLYRAFEKYGIESFDVDILYITDPDEVDIKKTLDLLEISFIHQYNSYGGTGYNQTRGGDAGILGYKFTEEQRQIVSRNSKLVAERKCKNVYFYDLKTGWTVKIPSLTKAAELFNTTHSQLSRLCSHKQYKFDNRWVGSFDPNVLQEWAKWVNENIPHKHKGPRRKRTTRVYDPETGKRILSEEQKEKIRSSLYRYIIEVYTNGTLSHTFETTGQANEEFFHFKNDSSVMDTVQRHMIGTVPYKQIYTFNYIDKRNTHFIYTL